MAEEVDVVAALALRQHGVFARTQLVGLGVPTSTIDRRLRQGRWLRLDPAGFYQLAGMATSLRSRLAVALLASPGAVVSHLSAALLHHIGPLPPDSAQQLHITRAGDIAAHRSLWRTHRVHNLDPRDLDQIDGLACTSNARTVIDLAAILGPGRYRELFQRVTSGPIRREDLEDALSRVPSRGKLGTRRVRQLIDAASDDNHLATSELEHRYLLLVNRYGLPMPVSQFLPPWRAETGIGRVDFGYPWARLLVEVDGRTWHAQERAFEDDRRRDQAATAAGWRTLRFTWSQVVHEPDEVAAVLRSTLAHAAA